MSEYSYLKPKVKQGDMGKRKREHGMFVNVSSYTKLGGFSSESKLPSQEPSMAVEKSPQSRAGKPI